MVDTGCAASAVTGRWRRIVPAALCLATLSASAGCTHIAREVVAAQYAAVGAAGLTGERGETHITLTQAWHNPDATGPEKIELSDEQAGETLVGTTKGQFVELGYPEGITRETAGQVVRVLDNAISHVGEQLGLDIGMRLKLTMVRIDAWPKRFRYSATVALREEALAFAIPFVGRSPTVWDLYTDEEVFCLVGCYVHELVEAQLMAPWHRPSAMMDCKVSQCWFFSGQVVYGTRWFRDGFANYAGRLASEAVLAQLRAIEPERRFPLPFCGHKRPLADLAAAGTAIFDWHQYQDDVNHYDACLGLFLLLEHRYGRSTIRRILEEMGELKRPDGPAIERVFDRVLGTSVRRLVRQFTFPPLGLEKIEQGRQGLKILEAGPAESVGARAGVQAGDVITAVDGRRPTDLVGIELAMLAAIDRGRQAIPCTVLRDGATVELLLELRAGEETGKR